MNEPAPTPFFHTGGAVPVDARSYIQRPADDDLFASLMRGEFCYVLVSRQMGKSSLMVRTAARLRDEGVTAVVLDLNAVGHNTSADQWYYTLLSKIADRLKIRSEMRALWERTRELSPLQRWMEAIQHILQHCHSGPLVIFVDEIDQVRLLPFSADEFFAAIRSCYSHRPEDPEFNRLAFCLLGVTLPSDLIRDPRITPFNVGRRIELTDFDSTQVLRLEVGLEREEIIGQVLLERVFYWTNGHPYLTQRLCREIVESPDIFTPQQVDALCERLFLTTDAQEQDDNLTFVRDRLLKSDADITELLTLYGQVYRGQDVRDDKANRLVTLLLLSGIVRSHDGRLQARNRIYERVFNRAWIQKHLPGTELRRQWIAYRRGVLRTAVWAIAIGLPYLTVVQFLNARKVSQAAAKEHSASLQATKAAQEKERSAEQFTYAYAIDRAQQFLQQGHTFAAVKLLQEQLEKLRGFEWRYLWQLGHGYVSEFHDHPKLVFSLAVSPDGRTVAMAGQDDENKRVALWDVVTRREIFAFPFASDALCVAFSPDGKILAAGGGTEFDQEKPGIVKLWDVALQGDTETLKERSAPQQYKGSVTSLAFSPDGAMLAVGSANEVSLWDVSSHHKTPLFRKPPGNVKCMAFSPGGATLAVGLAGGKVGLWNVRAKRLVRTLSADFPEGVWLVAFSPDGKTLATGGEKRIVRLRDVRTGQLKAKLPHLQKVYSVAFSPDGKTLATACWDDMVRLWDVATHRVRRTLVGHLTLVNSVAFTPDGKKLVSGGNDGMKLWDIDPQHTVPDAISQGSQAGQSDFGISIALSPDGRTLAAGGMDNVVRIWDIVTGRRLGTFVGHKAPIYQVMFSPNGRMLASSSMDDRMQLWNMTTRQSVSLLTGNNRFLAFSNDSKILVTGGANITLWDTTSCRKLRDLNNGHLIGVASMALSSDGDTLVVSGHDKVRKYGDGTVELWSLRTGQLLTALRGAHSNDINSQAFSLDGKRLATGGWDRSIRLWDLDKVRKQAEWTDPLAQLKPTVLFDDAGEVDSVAFSPDGKTLAAGNHDHTIKLWNLATQEEVAILTGHTDKVSSLVFSHDGNLLISGSLDGTVRFWRAPPPAQADAGP